MNTSPPPARGGTAIIRGYCPDARGINSALTRFISERNGNIVDYDQHVDEEPGIFFVRIEWALDGFALPPAELAAAFRPLADTFGMNWTLTFSAVRPRLALFVSKQPHCLYDLLARWRGGEWSADIPLIVSNHPDLEPVARQFGVEFRVFPITAENKASQERAEIALLREQGIDLVVLARYMQVLSEDFVAAFPNRILNIHHSFLPAFVGARPYHAAHARGVKLIGATSHYVTGELDRGPIIVQEVSRVSHKDSVADLIRKGKDLEKIALARALWHHLNHKILVYSNKTVIFE